MKKSELKNIIKECVKEVIFEEGVLSSIITEVAHGITSSPSVRDKPVTAPSRPITQPLAADRQKVLDAIGDRSVEEARKLMPHPELFEGTQPLREGKKGNALTGTDPSDAGLDISNIPGFGSWGALAHTK
jgi:hypothetical protein